ncbi:myeloid leukemia factor 1-like isoform X2 [Watersipora subatra]|uniref:myeloid leukemia factor 1-like isoform X2 n=1 Tax=Watersipora subatra TaxID=2589382 RepID=UPI00355B6E35
MFIKSRGFYGISDHGFPEFFDKPSIGFAGRHALAPLRDVDRSFDQMRRMMNELAQGKNTQLSVDGGNGHSYIQSSVYSYSRNADGNPEIYEAHHSNRHGPGGVREEKKALRDTQKKLEKMSVGRHIGARGHVVEKSKNTATGHMTHHQNLIGLQEADIDAHQREWQEKTKDWYSYANDRGIGSGREERRYPGHRDLGYGQRQQSALDNKPHKYKSSKYHD